MKLLDAFETLRKVTIVFVMSLFARVCSTGRIFMEFDI